MPAQRILGGDDLRRRRDEAIHAILDAVQSGAPYAALMDTCTSTRGLGFGPDHLG
jgi:hypothetical protein